MSLRNYIESTGSEFRNLKYSEVSNQGGPLIEKQISKTDGNTGGQSEFQTRVITPITARIDDVARITKLLTKAGGVRWELHQAELQAIQYNLENKRVGETTSPLTDTLLNVGKALVKDLGLTASTLAQVALSGTGEHQTTYISRAYLKSGGNSGILGTIGAATGITSGDNINGAAAALSGNPIGTENPAYLHNTQEAGENSTYFKGGLYNHSENPGETKNWKKPEKEPFNKRVSSSVESPYLDSEDHSNFYGKDSINRENVWDNATDIKAKRGYIFSKEVGNVENEHTNGSIGKNRLVGSGSYRYETLKEDFDGAVEIPELTDEYGNVLVEGSSKRYGSAKRGSILSDLNTISNTLSSRSYDGVGEENSPKTYSSESAYIVSGLKSKVEETITSLHGYSEPKVEYSLEYKSDFEGVDSLVPFILTTITPERRLYLSFQANLDSYDDSYTGEWEGTQYVGRAEKFYNYQGFDRKISFAFKVLAKTRSHLIPLYKNLNALAASTAPTYGDSGLFMRGTLTSVTVGDLLQNQIGFFTSVKLTWQQDYLWEIEKGDGYMRVPHALDVSVSFTPIHNFNVTADTWIGGTTGSYFGFDNSEVMNSVVENGNSENRKSQVNTDLRPNVTGTEDVLKEKNPK